MPKHLRMISFVGAIFTLLLVLFPIHRPTAQADAGPFRVYLTFEDGPTAAYTPQILDILAEYNAKATFFVIGFQIEGNETILQRILREGHAIGNHLWQEPDGYAGDPDESVQASYDRTETAIRDALGPELARYDAQPKLFRQPGGGIKPFPARDGEQVISYNWHVSGNDCGFGDNGKSATEIDEQVINNLTGGSSAEQAYFSVFAYGDGVVIALHDVNRVSARVLPTFLEYLQGVGVTFEALPRPFDAPNTMPIRLGVPPDIGQGIPGVTLPGVTLDYVRLRAAPSTDAPILVVDVPINTAITVIGRAPKWYQVEMDGQIGWMSAAYVGVIGPIPNLPVIE
ncbi:MAG: polysaccharide deacetylase family protein [Chloroflexi bacterium]|nr:polysaccharide deacetylase family protein [Chloroflexota bacterium]